MLACCIYSNNSLAMTSTVAKYRLKSLTYLYLPSAESYPIGQASYGLHLASIFFLSTEIFVQIPCRTSSNGKIYPPNTHVYSSTFHPKDILLLENSFLLKNVLFLLSLTRRERTRPLDRQLTSSVLRI